MRNQLDHTDEQGSIEDGSGRCPKKADGLTDCSSRMDVAAARRRGLARREKKIGGNSGFGEGPDFFYMCETSTLKSRCCFGIISSS